MITAENITDEQIRGLRDEPHLFSLTMRGADVVFVAAMKAEVGDRAARARCAEILNSRKAVSK